MRHSISTGKSKHRNWVLLICSLFIFASMGFLANKTGVPKKAAKKSYNVLFIMMDDLSNVESIYGHPLVKTPNFERLANRGVKFNNAYCQFSLCNPSRASLMTGLNPDRTGVYDLQVFFRKNIPDVVTLPQLFQKNGYYAARVGKIYHYGVPKDIGTNGMDDSLSWNQRINPIGRDKTDEGLIKNLIPKRSLGSTLAYLPDGGTDEEQTDGKVATEAIKLLEQNRNRPFFLAVGFFRPHTPYVAPKKYFDMYPLDKIKLPYRPANDMDDIPEAALFTKPLNWNLPEDKQKEAIRGYYAAVSFVDAQMGRVLDAVERLKLSDNTIIVVISDHGYNLGEHGQWMKQSLFENAARIPFVVSVPGGLKGKSSNRMVELVDLYPTLADLCHLTVPDSLSGKSIKPLLSDPDAKWDKPAYTQIVRGKIMGRSVRTGQWRYTEWDNGKAGTELYDELNDKGEYTNQANNPKYQTTVQELAILLRKSYNPQRQYIKNKIKNPEN